MMTAYETHRDYRFDVCGEEIAVSELIVVDDPGGSVSVSVEETRKNGQEDCHMWGIVVRQDGFWQWDELNGRRLFDQYHSPELSNAIVDYLNKHPHPELVEAEA